MANIQKLIQNLNQAKSDVKTAKDALETALADTQIYHDIFQSTLDASGDCTEKDAHKHAISISLKHFQKTASS